MKIDAMVSTVDILPTVIDATGAEPAVKMHGRSLRPVLSDLNADWREYLVGEFHMHGRPFYPRRACLLPCNTRQASSPQAYHFVIF